MESKQNILDRLRVSNDPFTKDVIRQLALNRTAQARIDELCQDNPNLNGLQLWKAINGEHGYLVASRLLIPWKRSPIFHRKDQVWFRKFFFDDFIAEIGDLSTAGMEEWRIG